jgi:phospholipase/carboxylesterase
MVVGQGSGQTMRHRNIHQGILANQGRLAARPLIADDKPETPPSIQTLSIDTTRFGLISVPPGYSPGRPAPLLVLLHGAGGDAKQALGWLQPVADENGLILLAPQSEDRTWDVIMGGFGPDVRRIDDALSEVFRRFAIDPGQMAIGGFSDGASYALTLGVINGTLFRHVIAFSPGFVAASRAEGHPRFFVSHGVGDTVLPIDACSRRLVPKLKGAGFEVLYREFDGGHSVPADIAREVMDWFLNDTR